MYDCASSFRDDPPPPRLNAFLQDPPKTIIVPGSRFQMSRHQRQREAKRQFTSEWLALYGTNEGVSMINAHNSSLQAVSTVDNMIEDIEENVMIHESMESENANDDLNSNEVMACFEVGSDFSVERDSYSNGCSRPSSESEAVTDKSFKHDIVNYFTRHKISRRARKELLEILNRHGINVPSSVYLLEKNESSVQEGKKSHVVPLSEGEFTYFSVAENIQFLVDNKLLHSCEVDMVFNIDGLPVFRSSHKALWPILMKVKNCSYSKPMPVASFYGDGKPELTSYIEPFVREVSALLQDGFAYKSHNFTFKVSFFTCDAVARSYLACVIGHTGFQGCQYCQQTGVFCKGRVVFPRLNCDKREDISYADFKENNQKSLSPLSAIVGLNSGFVPDPMHCVYLGVVRKLLGYYCSTTKNLRLPCRLSSHHIKQVSDRILRYRNCFGPEFQRKIRPLKELEHFKATEFRIFILYLCPVLMKDILPPRYFDHLLLLHFSMYVYASNDDHYFSQADACLHNFIAYMSDLFGHQSMIYNIHVLSHLPEFVRKYGALDSFSAFEFENYLNLIKRRLSPTREVFKNSVTQMRILRSLSCNETIIRPLFSSSSPNNCCIDIEFQVILIKEVADDGNISGMLLNFHRCLYTKPYSSEILKIGYYQKSRTYLVDRKVLKKCLIFQSTCMNEYLVIPYVTNND